MLEGGDISGDISDVISGVISDATLTFIRRRSPCEVLTATVTALEDSREVDAPRTFSALGSVSVGCRSSCGTEHTS